ncbi:MAG: hypothetical protein HQL87_09780 [Magnetococcales bacterium]|nr:hypothetical protein [Magnetococcales bacterium]
MLSMQVVRPEKRQIGANSMQVVRPAMQVVRLSTGEPLAALSAAASSYSSFL